MHPLLVTDLRVNTEQLGALQGLDESHSVTDRWQQDVAARFIRLRLDGETDVMSLVGHVLGEQGSRLRDSARAHPGCLSPCRIRHLATAPHDQGSGPEFCTEVKLAQSLAQSEATDPSVIGGESAVREDGGAEQVRGHHRDDQSGVGKSLLETVDLGLARGIRRSERE